MTAKKRVIGNGSIKSDLAKVDAHVIGPEEYDETPELSDAWFERADLLEGGRLVRRGRPPSSHPKQPVSLRLSPEVVDGFRATGRGWQSRIDEVLRHWLTEHKEKS